MFEKYLTLLTIVNLWSFAQTFEEVVEISHSDQYQFVRIVTKLFRWNGWNETSWPSQ